MQNNLTSETYPVIVGFYTEQQLEDINEFIITFRARYDKELLIKSVEEKATVFPTLEEIFTFICEKANIREEHLRSKSRSRKLVMLRQIYFYISKRYGYKLVKIAEVAGNKDHTTVMHGIKRMEYMIQNNNIQALSWYRIILSEAKNMLPLLEFY